MFRLSYTQVYSKLRKCCDLEHSSAREVELYNSTILAGVEETRREIKFASRGVIQKNGRSRDKKLTFSRQRPFVPATSMAINSLIAVGNQRISNLNDPRERARWTRVNFQQFITYGYGARRLPRRFRRLCRRGRAIVVVVLWHSTSELFGSLSAVDDDSRGSPGKINGAGVRFKAVQISLSTLGSAIMKRAIMPRVHRNVRMTRQRRAIREPIRANVRPTSSTPLWQIFTSFVINYSRRSAGRCSIVVFTWSITSFLVSRCTHTHTHTHTTQHTVSLQRGKRNRGNTIKRLLF